MGSCVAKPQTKQSAGKRLKLQHQNVLAQQERILFGTDERNKKKWKKSRIDSYREGDEPLDIEAVSIYDNDQVDNASCCDGDEVDAEGNAIDLTQWRFPFENLVFEGGGNKGLALIGAVKCLEELGIRSQVIRFAGTSAGAITAAMVALGYPYEDLMVFWSADIESLFQDHSCGYCSLLPNLLSKFGWNPGKRIMVWLGKMIAGKSKTNDPDMTFYDLYREMNVELCIVVTNLNLMSTEYCHPKTTPEMPIREALRMSISIPGVFEAPKYEKHGQEDVFVDGGLLCNYPIHCFDGWYLSMARSDAFLLRLQPLQKISTLMTSGSRFKEHNNKTLGFLLYSEEDYEVMRYRLERRKGAMKPPRPAKDTKIWKKKKIVKDVIVKAEREHKKVVGALEKFMQVLHKHNIEEQEFIDKSELQCALNDTELFPTDQAEILFGKDFDINSAFEALDKDKNGKIAFSELLQFIEERGIRLQVMFQGFGRREVKNFTQFLKALEGTMLTNMKYVYVKETDIDRTVGINTGHINTLDYDLENEDREFAYDRGYNATLACLRNCVANQYPGVVRK